MWTLLQFGGSRLTTMAVFVLLARILTPQDFGLVAIAMVFVTLLQIVLEGGFGLALIQREDLEPEHVNTVFWISVSMGTLLACGLAACGGPLAVAYHQPALRKLMPVLAIGVVLQALGSTQSAQLRRQLRFKPLAVRGVVGNVAGGIAGVGLALAGAGFWALAAQYLALNLVQTTTLWVANDWRPGLRVSRSHFADIFPFSRSALGNSLLQYANNNSDNFFVGVFLGPIPLGLYTVGYRLLTVLNDVVNNAMLGVAFPVYSRLQHDRDRLRRAYLSSLGVAVAVAMPVYLFFSVAAHEVVGALFGNRWAPAAPVMAALAVYGVVQTPVVITESCLNALGRPHVVFCNRAIGTAAQLAAFAVAAQFGIIWVAWALVARAYLLAPLPLWSLKRAGVLQVGPWLRTFLAPVPATATMLLAVWGVHLLSQEHLGATLRLMLMVLTAAAVYPLALAIFSRSTFREFLRLVFSRGPRPGRHRPLSARRFVRPFAGGRLRAEDGAGIGKPS